MKKLYVCVSVPRAERRVRVPGSWGTNIAPDVLGTECSFCRPATRSCRCHAFYCNASVTHTHAPRVELATVTYQTVILALIIIVEGCYFESPSGFFTSTRRTLPTSDRSPRFETPLHTAARTIHCHRHVPPFTTECEWVVRCDADIV